MASTSAHQQTPPPSASWEALGETFYRRQEIYSLPWRIQDLSDYVVAAAKNAGPIAMIRDDRKPVLLERHQSSLSRPKIYIYSCAGLLLQTIPWDSAQRIIALGWTLQESLVVLTQDGTYRLYPLAITTSSSLSSASEPIYSQHSLGAEAQESGVLQAKIFQTGLVALLGNLSFVHIKSWQAQSPNASESFSATGGGGKLANLAPGGLNDVPCCWAVIEPELSHTRGVEVLIGTGSTVLRLDDIEVQDQRLSKGPFLSITPSPNGRFVALLTSGTKPQLWVTSSDFQRSLSEFDLSNEGETGAPNQVVWCGNNTVVVAWDRTVVMVGPFGETLKYFYSDAVLLIGELDGTRIISNDLCEFLQIVPQSSQDVFRPGSTSPAAILFEAAELFDKRSPKSDEYIRSIRADLVGAVDTCIDAAGREYDPDWQKKLLKAASFGKSFLDLYNPSDFVMMTKTLRLLNAVRAYEVGLPLTYDQYQAQSPSYLISRLTSRSFHLLALKISAFLFLSSAPVLKHWAQSLISSAPSSLPSSASDSLVSTIVTKLQSQNDVSPADIALTAWQNGRNELATKLLEYEVRSSRQVPLLIRMKEDQLALNKAIESGDPSLVYTVLLHLKRSHALGDFFRFVDKSPEAVALLQVFAKDAEDWELLKDFYYQDDRRKETALLSLEESMRIEDFGDKVAKVRNAAKSFGEDKDCVFEGKMVDEHIRLLAFQQALESEHPRPTSSPSIINASLNQTLRQCILLSLPKKADKLKSDYKIPDKRFTYIKMKALVELRDWEALEQFSKSKKSPIGYEPWVEELVRVGCQRQAIPFIEKLEPLRRVDWFVKTGEWLLAGQECLRRTDRRGLHELRNKAPNAIISAQLDSLIEEMNNAGM